MTIFFMKKLAKLVFEPLAQTLETRWLRGHLQRLDAQAQRTSLGGPQWWLCLCFPRLASHRSSRHTGPWGTKQRSQRSDRIAEA